MAIDASTLPIKYERPLDSGPQGVTIWAVPEYGLYRVRQTSQVTFLVETLAPLGWIVLIELDTAQDGVQTPTQALQTWLDIQSKDEDRKSTRLNSSHVSSSEDVLRCKRAQ